MLKKIFPLSLCAFLITSCGRPQVQTNQNTSEVFQGKKNNLSPTIADELFATELLPEAISNAEAEKFTEAITNKAKFPGKEVPIGFMGKVDARLWQSIPDNDISTHPGFIPHLTLKTFHKSLKISLDDITNNQPQSVRKKHDFEFLGCLRNQGQTVGAKIQAWLRGETFAGDEGATKEGVSMCGKLLKEIKKGSTRRFTFFVVGQYSERNGLVLNGARQFIFVDNPNSIMFPTAVFSSRYYLSRSLNLISRPDSAKVDVKLSSVSTTPNIDEFQGKMLKSNLYLNFFSGLPTDITEASYRWHGKERTNKAIAFGVNVALTGITAVQFGLAVKAVQVAGGAILASGATMSKSALVSNGIRVVSGVARAAAAAGQFGQAAAYVLHVNQKVDAIPDQNLRGAMQFLGNAANNFVTVASIADFALNNPFVLRKIGTAITKKHFYNQLLSEKHKIRAASRGPAQKVASALENMAKAVREVSKSPRKASAKLVAGRFDKWFNKANNTMVLKKRNSEQMLGAFKLILKQTKSERNKALYHLMNTTSFNPGDLFSFHKKAEANGKKISFKTYLIFLAKLMGYEAGFDEETAKRNRIIFKLNKEGNEVTDIIAPPGSTR